MGGCHPACLSKCLLNGTCFSLSLLAVVCFCPSVCVSRVYILCTCVCSCVPERCDICKNTSRTASHKRLQGLLPGLRLPGSRAECLKTLASLSSYSPCRAPQISDNSGIMQWLVASPCCPCTLNISTNYLSGRILPPTRIKQCLSKSCFRD